MSYMYDESYTAGIPNYGAISACDAAVTSVTTCLGDIYTERIVAALSESQKREIKELFDEWCNEIVDKKVDKDAIDMIIPWIDHCQATIHELEGKIREFDTKILALQEKLKESQEQLKYIGFEKLLME